MEGLSSERGIFIPYENLELKSMIRCLHALLDIFPDIKVNSIKCDDRFGGFKIDLANLEAKNLLERKHLMRMNQRIRVYPLATCLMVHSVGISAEMERDFIDTIQSEFGKVLHLQKALDSTHTESTCSQFVLLDIPEIESLSVFAKNGYPRMSVTVPSMCKTFKVTFWCRRCREEGHSLQVCVEKYRKRTGARPTGSGENRIEMHSSFSSGSPTTQNSSFLEPIDSFTNKLGREVVLMSGMVAETGATKKESANDKAQNISRIIDSLKKSRESGDSPSVSKENEAVKEEPSKKNRPDSSGNDPVSNKECKKEFEVSRDVDLMATFPHATSTTDDEIQILEEKTDHEPQAETHKKENTPWAVEIKTERLSNNNTESSVFPNTSGTPQVISPNLQVPGPSTPLSSTLNQSTFNLSEQLEGCIQQAYDEHRILNRQRLDAFLIHVKKKSNPIRVAANYTHDVQGLKKQLQQILHYYYNTPQTGTKNDALFIKWLNGLVGRFEGPVVRKRKPSGMGLRGPPYKK